MSDFYDLTKSLLLAKAGEGAIAFASFRAPAADGTLTQAGMLKIAAFRRPNGSGYLTLTFVIDLDADSERRDAFAARFHEVGQDALAARLGPDFEMMLDVPLNAFALSEQFYLEELNLYFRRLAGRERPLLEGQTIPALAALLGFDFDSLEWLGEDSVNF